MDLSPPKPLPSNNQRVHLLTFAIFRVLYPDYMNSFGHGAQ